MVMEFIYERNVYDLSAYRKTSTIAAVSTREEQWFRLKAAKSGV
jgi:hypothetical protein